MPRCVRNFWLTAEVDGRKSTFATGPRGRDGGFTLRVYQRHNGDISKPFILTGRVCDGQVILEVSDEEIMTGSVIYRRVRPR